METRSNRFAIEIPGLASLILKHDVDAEVMGIDAFPDAHPPVAAVFWAFRIMVGVGLLMLVSAWAGAWALRRHGEPGVWLARLLVGMTFSGWVAVLAGWYVTEIGRQPFLVTGVLRTADAVTAVPASSIGISLVAYLLMYAVLMTSYISVLFYLARKAGAPESQGEEPRAYGDSPLAAAGLRR